VDLKNKGKSYLLAMIFLRFPHWKTGESDQAESFMENDGDFTRAQKTCKPENKGSLKWRPTVFRLKK